jgi:hypothetical protein
MLKATKTYLVLLLIFTFSFVYRLLLMFWQGYPPGADIGLHNSVIYSITGSGPTDFLYNYFHIGGGISLTFPGYHIFTAGVMMLTGMTGPMEYVTQALVVALFSSLTVLCAFLLTRRIWSTSAAYIVAFLVAISRFDIEMLMWAGYPNVITLLLIPLTFYLYLQKDRFSNLPFLISTSILVGSLFLTHSLSAGIFVATTAAAELAILLFPKTLGVTRKTALYWFLPIVLGAVMVSPFLAQAVPAYLKGSAYLTSSAGSSDIGSATISAHMLPLAIVLPIFGLIPAFLVFSKKFYNRWLTLPSFLLCVWVFVSLILTQGYLVNIPFDYNRFLYFLILPLLIFIAVLFDYVADFIAGVTDTYRTLTRQIHKTQSVMHPQFHRVSMWLTRKRLYSICVLVILLFSFIALPIFMTPSVNMGQSIQSFYQTMDTPRWEAMQWAKQNTAGNAVFVADALYGWWFGGFAQRPTLSAVDPQYLSLNREVDNATFARNLLDTDYIIDNNSTIIPQVRDDGGYIARHNPQILVRQNWTYYPSSFFNFDSAATSIRYHVDGNSYRQIALDQLAIKDTRIESDSAHATITTTRGNADFNYSISTTVTAKIRFVNITSAFTPLHSGVHLDWVDIRVETKPDQINYDSNITVGYIDVGTKAFGQLIFNTTPFSTFPDASNITLTYSFDGKADGQIQILATAYSESNNEQYYSSQAAMNAYFSLIMTQNLHSALQPIPENVVLNVFDYRAELLSRSVSYVALLRTQAPEAEILPKFQRDPLFSLVFINEEVAIFKVNGDLH